MKIKTSYPGQPECIVDAPDNVVRIYEKEGKFPPFVELYIEPAAKPQLDEVSFKSTYVATFLASYMAGRYIDDCMNGHIGKPYENQPVEDAIFNAECAWETYKEIYGV